MTPSKQTNLGILISISAIVGLSGLIGFHLAKKQHQQQTTMILSVFPVLNDNGSGEYTVELWPSKKDWMDAKFEASDGGITDRQEFEEMVNEDEYGEGYQGDVTKIEVVAIDESGVTKMKLAKSFIRFHFGQ